MGILTSLFMRRLTFISIIPAFVLITAHLTRAQQERPTPLPPEPTSSQEPPQYIYADLTQDKLVLGLRRALVPESLNISAVTIPWFVPDTYFNVPNLHGFWDTEAPVFRTIQFDLVANQKVHKVECLMTIDKMAEVIKMDPCNSETAIVYPMTFTYEQLGMKPRPRFGTQPK